jgi:hypothetical protein
MPTLTELLDEALKRIDDAIADVSGQLDTQPDNPKIKRASGSVSAFVISSKDIGDRWDPFYHDWKSQYAYVRELLEKRRFSALRTLLQAQMYRDPSHGTRTLAPEVIENVKGLTGDLLVAASKLDATRRD